MRIYINTLPNKIDLEKLSNYKPVNIQYKMIYSDGGIFKIENSIIYHFIIKKEYSKMVLCNTRELFCDMSEILYDKTNYIPLNHKLIEINKYKYKVNSKIYFIIEYVNKKIYNIYFETPNYDNIVINTIDEIINLIK